jgi:hypothetical protein
MLWLRGLPEALGSKAGMTANHLPLFSNLFGCTAS